MGEVPATVHRAVLRAALDVLGLPIDDLRSLAIAPTTLTVRYLDREASHTSVAEHVVTIPIRG